MVFPQGIAGRRGACAGRRDLRHPDAGGDHLPRPVGLTRLGASARRLATMLRKRGLPIAIRCAAMCTTTVEVRVDAATRRRLGLRSTRLGRRTALLSSRARSMTVPFSATTLRRVRRAEAFRVTVQATVRGAQNARRTTRLTLR